MIIVTGEALVDLVITPAGAVEAALGGAPFNTARACGRLGADVRFVGAISVDRFGSMLAAQLAADGVDTSHLVRVEAPTTLAGAEVDEDGVATYRFYFDGTSAPALSEIPAAALAGDLLFAGGLGLVLEPMATAVESAIRSADPSQVVMVDVNCRPKIISDRDAYIARLHGVLRHAHVVKVSDEDLEYLQPGVDQLVVARSLLAAGPTALLVTRGGGGVHVMTADREAIVEIDAVEVVDTIGAGDSFGAGFASWWVEAGLGVGDVGDLDALTSAVRAGTSVARVVVGRRGADPPWRRELAADWSPG